jgi:hypothetical protein
MRLIGARALRLGSAVGMALATLAAACGNGADGVGACRQIEEARCRRAPSCSVALEPPVHTSGNDVDACIRFYDIACLHGLDVPQPSLTVVNACVDRIRNSSDCAIVTNPASDPRCAWLSPGSTAIPDASSADTAPAVDAAADAADATSD